MVALLRGRVHREKLILRQRALLSIDKVFELVQLRHIERTEVLRELFVLQFRERLVKMLKLRVAWLGVGD